MLPTLALCIELILYGFWMFIVQSCVRTLKHQVVFMHAQLQIKPSFQLFVLAEKH